MKHIVLIGDSIFDNGSYVPEGRDVLSHLERKLAPDSCATLLAVDGATTDQIMSQIARIPGDATHLALSAGGNDALQNMAVLTEPSGTVAEALFTLSIVRERFAASYLQLVSTLEQFRKPLVVCTIYHPPMFEELAQPAVGAALSMFNDTIVSVAIEKRISIIDTRLLCREELDFENVIEPSDIGGAKIAEALARSVVGLPAYAQISV